MELEGALASTWFNLQGGQKQEVSPERFRDSLKALHPTEANSAPETMLLTMMLDHPLPYETQFLLIEVYGSIYDILYFVNTQILKQVK